MAQAVLLGTALKGTVKKAIGEVLVYADTPRRIPAFVILIMYVWLYKD
jgi:hypothetical protein